MPRTTERSSDRFAGSVLITRTLLAFNSAVCVPIVLPYTQKAELLETGISVGTITGGTTPSCYLDIVSCDASLAMPANPAKGTTVYDGSAMTCAASKTAVKKFDKDEFTFVTLPGSQQNQAFSTSAVNYGLCGYMKVQVNGSPTSIATALAWVRIRPYWEE